MANQHGDYIWYELMTSDADAAQEFYGKIIGWHAKPADQAEMDYWTLAMPGEEAVAGLVVISTAEKEAGAVPSWLGYIGVDDVDASAAKLKASGCTIYVEPQNIPNVGRFAMIADPQGAAFYIMRGFSDETSHSFVATEPKVGHCAWNELSTSDPAAAVDFYGDQFGWKQEGDMDMGPMGKYLFLYHGSGMIGAIMPKMPEMLVSAWMYYFRVPDIDVAVETIKANGGTILQQPVEIPRGDYSLTAMDPAGAAFGLVGARL